MRLVRDRDEWDVQLEGRIVRIDRPGAPPAIVRCESAEDARAAHRDAVAERLADGYVEAPDPVADREARLVYADELQLRGDPIGELIAVHHELESMGLRGDPRRRKRLENRAAAILDQQHDAWFGALARFVRKPARKGPANPLVEIAWRLGFAEAVLISGAEEMPLQIVYAKLRELPLSRQIRGLIASPPLTGPNFAPLLDAMLEHGIPSRLDELVIGDGQQPRWPEYHLIDLAAVVAAAPALETLRLLDSRSDLALASPRLRTLEAYAASAIELAEQLGAAVLPRLEELVLHARRPIAPPPLDGFPALARLTLDGFGRAGARALVEHLGDRMPPSLRELALPRCGLQDHDLSLVLRNPDPFARLARIDLRGNDFSRAFAVEAKRRLPALKLAAR